LTCARMDSAVMRAFSSTTFRPLVVYRVGSVAIAGYYPIAGWSVFIHDTAFAPLVVLGAQASERNSITLTPDLPSDTNFHGTLKSAGAGLLVGSLVGAIVATVIESKDSGRQPGADKQDGLAYVVLVPTFALVGAAVGAVVGIVRH
jgi:hypothetical protein